MRLRDLPGSIGTEALDADLATTQPGGDWTAAEIDALRAALDRRHLLLLRCSPLSGPQQLAFVARFGPLLSDPAPWSYVSNNRADTIVRDGELLFHSDFAFTPTPVTAIGLHALEVPADGAPTLFADAARAARLLPADLKARLAGRVVLNVYDFSRGDDRQMRVADVDPRAPRHAQPVLARHPRTGEQVVAANQLHSDSIVGLPAAESDALLAEVFAVLYDGANVLEHRWSVGDLVLWDNVALHHGRRAAGEPGARTLQRVTLGTYAAAELVPNLNDLLRPRPATAGVERSRR